ncbi:hypothetical protein R5022_07445 [Pseudomonas aeruginosa]|uniref:hypothetical protein n=1 Tax=Pseudomonas aeruginosa TaxID=287 RepID=UPI0005BEE6AF|nr:hypothetical protein [Pseudomonas aeruginosa]WOU27686.1 hypothetical protein R5022_07445 [Pseudomonas aeruginosa]BAQ36955.1 aatii restriction endonuclease [Pseudomonas aeruginosa]HBO7620156.1 hypothetical protein [Pseudomonas aeruginosa]HBO7626232.1 hypothetical protein [Pseudomonas aeruginosa]HBO7639714.1 hypothetical protein [Pseudomonas aeruginosa]
MDKQQIIESMVRDFRGEGAGKARKYVGGLLPAFCEFLIELETPKKGYSSLSDFFADYPQLTEGVSTLTVSLPAGGQKTIRPAYERYHDLYIVKNHRLDYPRSQPYATGKWSDYRQWLDALVGMPEDDLKWIIAETVSFVLNELKDQSFDPNSVRVEPPIFKWLLEQFDFSARAKGEPTGAAFQAMVFGYIRADAPHLQVEARKARAGSARTKGIGDIDAWEGDRLVISAEVKHFTVSEKDIGTFAHFSSSVIERGALGMIVSENYVQGAREMISALGIHPLSRLDILHIVSLWDPLKQRAALNAFQWVVVHKEQNSGLIERVNAFLESVGYLVKR